MVRKAVALLLAVFVSLPLFAQQMQMPQLGETMDVSIINVDVVVTDKQGNRVHGLTKDDFEMYERGRLKPISNFAEYASAMRGGTTTVGGQAVEEAAAVEATPQRQPRTVVIFIERMRLLPFEAKKFFASIENFLDAAVTPEDKVSVVYWTPTTTTHLDFTSDRSSIREALKAIQKVAEGAQLDDAASLRDEVFLVRDFERTIAEMAGREPAAVGGADGSLATMLPMTQAMTDMKRRVHAVNSTIATMGAAEGRKMLLLATRRFGAIAGAEFQHITGAELISNELRQQFSTADLMKTVIANANANGVSIYPIFAPGLAKVFNDASMREPLPPNAEWYTLQNETSNLETIARRTGGLSASSVVDIVKLMPQIAADVNDYYSLAYRVTDKREDRARQIVVKTKNPEYRVRSRETFVEKSDETRMKDRLTAALFTAQNESPIPLTVELGQRRKSGKNFTIPVTVQIPISALTSIPQGNGRHAGAFTVYIAGAKDLDEVSDYTHKTQPFEIPERDLERAMAGHFTYAVDVLVNAKTSNVAIGVLDEVSKQYGVARLAVDAPRLASR